MPPGFVPFLAPKIQGLFKDTLPFFKDSMQFKKEPRVHVFFSSSKTRVILSRRSSCVCSSSFGVLLKMRLNKYLTQLTTRSAGVVSGQSFGSSVVSLPCITSMCSVECFPGGHSLCLALDHSFTPIPPPFYSSTVESVSQVPGSIGVGAHGWRVRVCQPWGRNSV